MVSRVKSVGTVKATPQVRRAKPPTVGSLGNTRKGVRRQFADRGMPPLPKPAWRTLPPGMPYLERVTSSNVFAYGYSGPDRMLYVQFRRDRNPARALPGWIYRYSEIPPELWQAFKKAKSKGKFVWRRLRRERGNGWRYARWTGQAWRPMTALKSDQRLRRKQRQKARQVQAAIRKIRA